ncbi:winged helix-turn-helix domain-containing protein [Streptomyces sp. DfronAA-171]|uniref:winged helix-turn-helix domain-containing protein n=1 Tax=Streptomyces sp. DfronAA-171 TaxID=1839777 RepID=UPI00081D3EC8|nr:winged helix-turn-helix domain-containing protein [Streptomyces sp. DfronAA-171]SCE58841.1 regulatory protein, gntR family [Streptomyces sp. DfronAA-171]
MKLYGDDVSEENPVESPGPAPSPGRTAEGPSAAPAPAPIPAPAPSTAPAPHRHAAPAPAPPPSAAPAPFGAPSSPPHPLPPTPAAIAAALRDRIARGVLKAGDRIPTQAELSQEFGVERGRVRQALQALRAEGLLSHSTKGVPPRVAQPGHDGERAGGGTPEPRPTLVALGPRLVRAFAAPEVRIDALCLTAESLIPAVSEAVIGVHSGSLRPESVDVRILLPSRSIDLAFPVAASGEPVEAAAVHRRWLEMRDSQVRVLSRTLTGLRQSHGTKVSVAFRTVPFTPPVKLYVLNGSEALFAYYLVRRTDENGEDVPEMIDTWGPRAQLFPYDVTHGPRDEVFVAQSARWFEGLWQTISEELKLDG